MTRTEYRIFRYRLWIHQKENSTRRLTAHHRGPWVLFSPGLAALLWHRRRGSWPDYPAGGQARGQCVTVVAGSAGRLKPFAHQLPGALGDI